MIIFTHHTGESHGILGAQLAATFLQRSLSRPAIVVGVLREFSKERLLDFVEGHESGKDKIAAFSHLCGRRDLIALAADLKQRGFLTLLGGPQAVQDYRGEPGADSFINRFGGLRSVIDIAFQGPVDRLRAEDLSERGRVFQSPWTRDLFLDVDWTNLYTFSDTLRKVDVRLGQVVNAIGCAYAHKKERVILPPPVSLREQGLPDLEIPSEGCIFCDVSLDKGYHGSVDHDRVLAQIEALPEMDGRKIPFELIDEYPIRSLGRLLESIGTRAVRLSQINLVCRVDDINSRASDLPGILSLAKNQGVSILFSSVGFESFSDRLLRYFSKGITVAEIATCVETLRRLKERFGTFLKYRRDEGANHGFIHPTPWDDAETMREMNTNIFLYRFIEDILPEHSTPLIIHHASYLADWIRQLESLSTVRFNRGGTWIDWWNPSGAPSSAL